MSNQFPRDPKAEGNMTPNQAAPLVSQDPRSQRPFSDRRNTENPQPPPSMHQTFGAASWHDPMSGAQYYGNGQYAPQNSSYNQGFYMPNSQQMTSAQQIPGYPPTNFGQQSFREPFDPAAETLRQWAMGTTRQYNGFVQNTPNNGWSPNMQYSGQQYPGQQAPMSQTQLQQMAAQQMQFQQTPVQRASVQQSRFQPEDGNEHDLGANSANYDDYAENDMEDDPSAQLMEELTSTARSPSPQIRQSPKVTDTKDKGKIETRGAPPGDSVQSAHDWSKIFAEKPSKRPEGDVFKSFTDEIISTEAMKIQQRQLEEQVDQVIVGLDDEDMQDITTEDQDIVYRTPDYTDSDSYTDQEDNIDLDDVEDFATEEELQAHVDIADQVDDLPTSPVQISHHVAEGLVADEEEADEGSVEHDAEEETVEANLSDAESFADQEAHDSGAESSTFVAFEGYELAKSPWKTVKTKVMKKEDKELHQMAAKLIPHHLPPSRYWAAVLMHNVLPNKAKVEKDFIWMKGHKFNSVETIYNKYKEVTTEENHRILFCGEPPDFDDVLEELDVFDDKLVVFRAYVQPQVLIEID